MNSIQRLALLALAATAAACGATPKPKPAMPVRLARTVPLDVAIRVDVSVEEGLAARMAEASVRAADQAEKDSLAAISRLGAEVEPLEQKAAASEAAHVPIDGKALEAERVAAEADRRADVADQAAKEAAERKRQTLKPVAVVKSVKRASPKWIVNVFDAKRLCPGACKGGKWTGGHSRGSKQFTSLCHCQITVMERPAVQPARTSQRVTAEAEAKKAKAVRGRANAALKLAAAARGAANKARSDLEAARARLVDLRSKTPEQRAQEERSAIGRLADSYKRQLENGIVSKKLGYVSAKANAGGQLRLVAEIKGDGPGSMAVHWRLVDTLSGNLVEAGTVRPKSSHERPDAVLGPVIARLDSSIEQFVPKRSGSGPATALAAVGAAPKSATDGSKTWAVVIGIEEYREQLAKAPFGDADAIAFASYLKVTMGVPASQIKLLTGNRAGRSDIAAVVEEWLPRNAKPGSRVIFFFSGHGAPNVATGDAYLVPWDGDPAYLKTKGYALEELDRRLSALKGVQSLLILDACFSGSGARSVLGDVKPLVPVKYLNATGTVRFAASGPAEATGVAQAGGHGMFTHHVLRGLAGAADANSDKSVTLAELTAYVGAKVSDEARLANREQTPALSLPAGLDPEGLTLVKGLQ